MSIYCAVVHLLLVCGKTYLLLRVSSPTSQLTKMNEDEVTLVTLLTGWLISLRGKFSAAPADTLWIRAVLNCIKLQANQTHTSRTIYTFYEMWIPILYYVKWLQLPAASECIYRLHLYLCLMEMRMCWCMNPKLNKLAFRVGSSTLFHPLWNCRRSLPLTPHSNLTNKYTLLWKAAFSNLEP